MSKKHKKHIITTVVSVLLLIITSIFFVICKNKTDYVIVACIDLLWVASIWREVIYFVYTHKEKNAK